jgi:polar amino acid transport system substrate-binding protein
MAYEAYGRVGRRLWAMPRWLWAAALALAALGLALQGWRWLGPGEDSAWDRIQAQGRLVVATDASYPPFSAVDADGNLFGFDIDLADEIGRRWGVAVVYENLTYDALVGALVVGRDDMVVSAFVPQLDRLHQAAYTRPYFTGGIVTVIRAGDGRPLAGDPAQWAAGQRLAVEYGAGGDALARQWARRVAGVEVLPLATAAEALAAVEAGEADAALVDALSAYNYLTGRPALRLTGQPVEAEPYVIAVAAGSRTLRAELDRVLAEMEGDGTLAELRVKWLGEAAR